MTTGFNDVCRGLQAWHLSLEAPYCQQIASEKHILTVATPSSLLLACNVNALHLIPMAGILLFLPEAGNPDSGVSALA